MKIKITRNDRGNPPGKLADAELHFDDGVLDGLKLIGFAVWERRNSTARNVTFPARQYSVNGERRSFALLRPVMDGSAQDRLRDLILEAYAADEEQRAEAEAEIPIGRSNDPYRAPERPTAQAIGNPTHAPTSTTADF